MKKIISTEKAPKAIGPYSQAVQVGNMIYLSGQLPMDPIKGEIVAKDIVDQTKQSLENIKTILQSLDLSMDHIIKTTVLLEDINDFSQMNEVYESYFTEGNYPSRTAYEVSKLPKSAKVEIEVIACKE